MKKILFALGLTAFSGAAVAGGAGPMTLTDIKTGSSNGSSSAINVTGTSYTHNADGSITQLSATTHAEFDINPLPNNELFTHEWSGMVLDGSGGGSVTAYQCIEGTFGGTVGANLCANATWGANFINETSVNYNTVPGVRILGGDDLAADGGVGVEQQASDYYCTVTAGDIGAGAVDVVCENAAWIANPTLAGVQLTFSSHTVTPPAMIDVPDVTGQAEAAAEAAILAANLTVGTKTSAASPTVPAGDVISQNPAACTACANTNDPVDLEISTGPAALPEDVPDVVGQLEADAETMILAANLTVGTKTSAASPTVPAGSVISQNPAACTACANTNDPVDLEISTGPAALPEDVPDVVGQLEADAEAAILAANLTVGTKTSAASPTVPAGSVISQNPVACTACANTNDPVDLEISTGPAAGMIDVPDVTGQLEADAEAAILAANLTVGTKTSASNPTIPAGSVISQNPAACTACANTNDPVDLEISTGPAMGGSLEVTLDRVTTGSSNGQSDAVALTTTGTWMYDEAAGTVTLSGTQLNEFDINPLPGNELFNQTFTDAVLDLGAVTAIGTAYDCIEGTFGASVGASLCGNYSWGANFIDESSTSYTTVPGTRVIGGDDTIAGDQQQLSDYGSALASFDGTTLIIQTPDWNDNLAPGSDAGIQLEFTVAAAQVDVPDVVGQAEADATAAITAAGLVPAVTNASDPVVPAGSVISQNPAACTACADAGSTVDIVVSDGPAASVVPDVVGQTEAAATAAITGAGLVVGNVGQGASATVPAGSVISQSPAGGASVPGGSAVDLVVSVGAGVDVPNVIGRPLETAQTDITDAGLTVGTITESSSETVPTGLVISQSPDTCEECAAPGSAVDLEVSSGPTELPGGGTSAISPFSLAGLLMLVPWLRRRRNRG